MIEINLQKIIGTHEGQVKVTRGGKMFTQTRRLGKKPSGRTGTGKLDKLPSDVKDSIIELRNLNYSGTQIKDNIETMLETADPDVRQKLIDANVITENRQRLADPKRRKVFSQRKKLSTILRKNNYQMRIKR
jgi:hypothetical protein